ncbi:hypothetical protein EXU85_20075 [Spirosoma sp. KCTC 42546]|uniref:hypothetical protein n=1 Tax=Spirosoma sp. KCTC 42546 TaxID=2520506 RepID=UPI00115AE443|nr:hypothetical protein [Spirosoma sp. KCTC 42546]QDK80779.1 hypothetical protein EXU85_20075 [Spirosoma sp. KCTC 42546]
MYRLTYIVGVILIGFFFLKVVRFQALGYTFNDMYAFVQMSRSWMDGRPFMYENIWGYHHKIHNYYTVLLWGPLCRAFGAYGLFAVQVSLLLISYIGVTEHLYRRQVTPWIRYVVVLVILLGPVSFWLNDHPTIGWHTELTYLPFALLFALALLGKRKLWAVIAGLAIVLVKEDGAVLAALIHLAYEGLQLIRKRPGASLWNWLLQGRFWLIAVGWVVIFLVGMIWVGYKNNFAEPRLQIALSLLSRNIGERAFWRQMLVLLGQSVLLVSPIVGLLGLLVSRLRDRFTGRLFLLWGIGVLVLTMLNFVQSVHYYDQPLFYLVSLTWPPRFVLLWAFSVAFLTILTSLFADQILPIQPATSWLIGAGLFIVQVPILYLTRPDFPSVTDWLRTFRGYYSSDKNPIYLQPSDITVVQCLADKLPHDANVFVFDFLVPYFHRQYEIWPTGKHYRPADIALIPIDDMQGLRKSLPMHQPYRVLRLKGYNLYVSPAYEETVKQCIP